MSDAELEDFESEARLKCIKEMQALSPTMRYRVELSNGLMYLCNEVTIQRDGEISVITMTDAWMFDTLMPNRFLTEVRAVSRCFEVMELTRTEP